MKDRFMNCLKTNDLKGLVQLPKSDLHNQLQEVVILEQSETTVIRLQKESFVT